MNQKQPKSPTGRKYDTDIGQNVMNPLKNKLAPIYYTRGHLSS